MPRLPIILAHVAAVIAGASGCSSDFTQTRGSCEGFVPNQKDIAVLGDVACEIASEGAISSAIPSSSFLFGAACNGACGPGFGTCRLPDDYVHAYLAARPISVADASAAPDATDAATPESADASVPICPAEPGTVKVRCSSLCEGRRTEGIREPRMTGRVSTGAYFATCSYLETVSVHAFARLCAELEAHNAPRELVDGARRAKADELRHAELTRALARRFDVEPGRPSAPPAPLRPLIEVARENAIEGCVRETYGAAVALIRAARARDPHVRTIARSIARDECEHAALSWSVAEWAMSRLDDCERATVRSALRQAVFELASGSDDNLKEECRMLTGAPTSEERRRLVALLDDAVFRTELNATETKAVTRAAVT